MGDKKVKQLRNQVRNAVEELIPSVLTNELITAGHEQLKKEIEKKLEIIDAHLKASLKAIDDRTKDAYSYILRSIKPSVVENGEKADESPKQGS